VEKTKPKTKKVTRREAKNPAREGKKTLRRRRLSPPGGKKTKTPHKKTFSFEKSRAAGPL